MKKILLPILLLLSNSIWSQEKSTPSLLEVNPFWKGKNIPLYSAEKIKTEKQLIQTHLRLVEQTLRNKPIPHLSASQKSNRFALLDELHIYWQNGKFPQNKYHNKRTPYFIDEKGTACAVGHLLLQTKQNEIVEAITQQCNFEKLNTLATLYPTLNIWATENGFGLDELAWIQPLYCIPPSSPTLQHVSCFGGNDGEYYPDIDPSWTPPFTVQLYARWQDSLWFEIQAGCDLPAGDYKAEIIDADSMVYEEYVTLTQPDTTFTLEQITHSNVGCDGTVLLGIVGATPEYSAFWPDINASANYREEMCPGDYLYVITHECGYYEEKTITIDQINSIQETEVLKVSIYPNPFETQLNIQIKNAPNSMSTVCLYDISGKAIQRSAFTGNLSILNLEILNQGIYFMTIKNETSVVKQKLIKY